MSVRFTVLASGSGGNSSLIEAGGFGLLVDVGLGPRQLAGRLAAVGASWHGVHAVVLTHTHGDHWRDTTLAHLHRRGIPLYCHADHHLTLREDAPAFLGLLKAGLVREYQAGETWTVAPGLTCRPFPVRHDGGATFGFRFEATRDLFGQALALGYAADLGSWTAEVAEALAEVDLLALEFNHDVHLERASGRSPRLIGRVLGPYGHLSNEQATELLAEVLRRTAAGRLGQVVQLHLSRDCNRPALAANAARRALAALGSAAAVVTASQDEPTPTVTLGGPSGPRPRPSSRPRGLTPVISRRPAESQPWLPGLEC
jgi:phosphoribosyl 1,2-cyclic phosphodiesterase